MKHLFMYNNQEHSFDSDSYAIELNGECVHKPKKVGKWSNEVKNYKGGGGFYWLNITEACNLNCSYCYTTKNNKISGHMTKEIGMKAIDYMVSKNHKTTRISLFGGEPFLVPDLLKFFVSYAMVKFGDRKVSFSAATNGTLLTPEICRFIALSGIKVQVSIDGTPDQHNKNRKTKKGGNTSHLVEKGIRNLLNAGVDDFSVSMVYSGDNLNLIESFKYLMCLGTNAIVTRPADASPYMKKVFSEKDYTKLQEEFKELEYFISILDRNDVYLYPFNNIIQYLKTGQVLNQQCNCGVNCHSISSDGSANPCHRFKATAISTGHLNTAINDAKKDFDLLRRTSECNTCWARGLCGGPCPSEQWVCGETFNDTMEMKCRIYKLEMETALRVLLKQKGL